MSTVRPTLITANVSQVGTPPAPVGGEEGGGRSCTRTSRRADKYGMKERTDGEVALDLTSADASVNAALQQ